jgi:hypothetical protein
MTDQQEQGGAAERGEIVVCDLEGADVAHYDAADCFVLMYDREGNRVGPPLTPDTFPTMTVKVDYDPDKVSAAVLNDLNRPEKGNRHA